MYKSDKTYLRVKKYSSAAESNISCNIVNGNTSTILANILLRFKGILQKYDANENRLEEIPALIENH